MIIAESHCNIKKSKINEGVTLTNSSNKDFNMSYTEWKLWALYLGLGISVAQASQNISKNSIPNVIKKLNKIIEYFGPYGGRKPSGTNDFLSGYKKSFPRDFDGMDFTGIYKTAKELLNFFNSSKNDDIVLN